MPSLRPSGPILRRPADSLTSSGGLFRKAASSPTVLRKVRVISRSPSSRPQAQMVARGLWCSLHTAASCRKKRPVATSASPPFAVLNVAPAQSKLVPGFLELVTYTRVALATFAARLLYQCHLGLAASTLFKPGEVSGPKSAEDSRVAEVRAASVGIAWLHAASELAGRFYETTLVWFDKLPGPASGKYIAVVLIAFLAAIVIHLKRKGGISMAAAQAWEGMGGGITERDFVLDLRKAEAERMLGVALYYAAAMNKQASSAAVKAADKALVAAEDSEMVAGEEEVMVPALGASGGRGGEGSGGAQLAQAKAAEEERVKQLAKEKAAEQERWKQLAQAKAAEESQKLSEEVRLLAKEKAAEEERIKRLGQVNVTEEEQEKQLAQMKAADLAQEKAAEEKLVQHLAQMKAAEEERMVALAKERAAEEARRLSAEVKQLAHAKTAEAERVKQLAQEKAAEEERVKQLAQEKAAEEERVKQLAQQKAAEEERVKQLAQQKAAEEERVKQLAQEKAAEEERVKQLAQLKSAEEKRMVALASEKAADLAQEKAAQEERGKQLAQMKAAEEERMVALAKERAAEAWQNACRNGVDMKPTAEAKIRKRRAEDTHAEVNQCDGLPAQQRQTSKDGAKTGESQANAERATTTEEPNAEGEIDGVTPESDKSKEALAEMKVSETKRMLALAREGAARPEHTAGKEQKAAAGEKGIVHLEEAESRQVGSSQLSSADAPQLQQPLRIAALTVSRSAAAADVNILGLAMGAARGYDLRRQKLQHLLCDASKGLAIINQRRSERREFLLRFLNKKLEPCGSNKPIDVVPSAVSDLARWVETSPSPPEYSFEGKWKVLYSTDEMLLQGSGDSTYYCTSSSEGAEQVRMENAVSFSFNFNFDMEFSRITSSDADAVVTLSRKLSGRPDEKLVSNGASAAPQICSPQTCSQGGALEVHYVDQFVCIVRRAQQQERLTILASAKSERVQKPHRSSRKGNMVTEQATAAISMPTLAKSEPVFFSEEELSRIR